MKTIDVRKTRRSLASYVRDLNGDPVLVQLNGKLIAALVPLTDMDWESFAVSTNPKFAKIIEEARKSFQLEGGLTTEEVCEQLGIKLAKPSRAANPRPVTRRKAG